jgi:hypothetical protein
MINVRLVNSFRKTGGHWAIDIDTPNHVTTLNYIKSALAVYREVEPTADWHLETRGTVADWHRWEVDV